MGTPGHDDEKSLDRPRVFGDYVLLGALAEGGMGTVHLASRRGYRPDIQRFCAVKRLRGGLVQQSFLNRFHDEARIVVTLNHRALCHVFDVGIVGEEHYIAMELIEGATLHALCAAQRASGSVMDPALALYVMDEVLDALEYAHGHVDPSTGAPLLIVHRDVSPHNVMLTFQGGVQLIDFGVVASIVKSERTRTGVVVGKLAYMSPEQARGEVPDARTDVYAAAVVLFELLSGRRFYGDLGKGATSLHLVEGTYEASYDEIPEVLVPPLRRALAPERDDRTKSCAAFQQELATALPRRAGTRDLREVLGRDLPDERLRQEEVLRRAREALRDAPTGDEPTLVRHIATAEARPVDDEATRTLRLVAPAAQPPLETTPTLRLKAPVSDAQLAATRTLRLPAPIAPLPSQSQTRTDATKAAPALRRGGVALVAIAAFAAIAVVALRAASPPSRASTSVAAPASGDAPAASAMPTSNGTTAPTAPTASTTTAPTTAPTTTAPTTTAAPALPEPSEPPPPGDAPAPPPKRTASKPSRAPRPSPRPATTTTTATPDLSAQLDSLARACPRAPCATALAAQRARIPLLDVAGLRKLRRDADACLAECRP